ncbi:hypothetical protein WR25_05591 [Diploscapter pachys]|uniref:Uncharacterized protein n=1 Tax=Diploscapter pachys TaxID=2018661 RepID=A0A2A2LT10_9BILA|nr:hypothetical protein WR25_05591 [Diploscapter pachys]
MEPTREQSTERIDGTDGMETEVEEGQADKMNVGGAAKSHIPSSQARHVQPAPIAIDKSQNVAGNILIQTGDGKCVFVCVIVWREAKFVYLLVVLPGCPSKDN